MAAVGGWGARPHLKGGIAALFLFFILCGTGQATPPPQPAQPRVVEVGIYISNLFDINYVAGSYKISFWLWFKSDDEKSEPEKQIEIIGGRDIKIEAIATERLADGRFYRSAKYTATINQVWDVRWYPFDTQKLKVVIESASDDAEQLKFVVDSKGSRFDKNVALPGWRFRSLDVQEGYSVYETDFGIGNGAKSIYPKISTTITLDHEGSSVFSTAFLGFFVADLLTGVTLFVESFEVTRMAIPLIGRLNMVVGSLFGAVGNKYVVDNSLPPRPDFSLSDLVQITAFSAIGVSLFTVIGTETLMRLGYSPALVSAVARSGVGLYLASQVGLGAYFLGNASE